MGWGGVGWGGGWIRRKTQKDWEIGLRNRLLPSALLHVIDCLRQVVLCFSTIRLLYCRVIWTGRPRQNFQPPKLPAFQQFLKKKKKIEEIVCQLEADTAVATIPQMQRICMPY